MPNDSDTAKLRQLATKIREALISHGLILTTAESCTGGWASQVMTSISGSSKWFERGFVTYTNSAKEEMLGVKRQTLKTHGAVSQETACEMAEGAISHSHANISFAITGIAGPEGGTPQKPVGTVWIAWSIRHKEYQNTTSSHYLFEGKRSQIRKSAVIKALEGLVTMITPTLKKGGDECNESGGFTGGLEPNSGKSPRLTSFVDPLFQSGLSPNQSPSQRDASFKP